jgi:hypothetical protein
MNAVADSKWHTFMYYLIQIPGAYLRHWWNNVVRKVFRIRPERSQETWDKDGGIIQANLTWWQEIGRALHTPFYPLHNKAWQVNLLKANKYRACLKRVLLKEVGPYNYLTRLLFGDLNIPKSVIDDYKMMSNWRWGVTLNETNRRYNYILPDELVAANAIEKDLLTKVWGELNELVF